MIEEKRWLCEYCHAEFNSKERCLEHEKSHIRPIKIINSFYNTVANPPIKIHVACNHETVLEYEFSRVIQTAISTYPTYKKEEIKNYE